MFTAGYSNISKRYLLGLHEKLLVINYHNPVELLNKRSELMTKCRHENKFLKSHYKGKMISNPFIIFIAKFLYIKEYYVNIYLPDDREIVKLYVVNF